LDFKKGCVAFLFLSLQQINIAFGIRLIPKPFTDAAPMYSPTSGIFVLKGLDETDNVIVLQSSKSSDYNFSLSRQGPLLDRVFTLY